MVDKKVGTEVKLVTEIKRVDVSSFDGCSKKIFYMLTKYLVRLGFQLYNENNREKPPLVSEQVNLMAEEAAEDILENNPIFGKVLAVVLAWKEAFESGSLVLVYVHRDPGENSYANLSGMGNDVSEITANVVNILTYDTMHFSEFNLKKFNALDFEGRGLLSDLRDILMLEADNFYNDVDEYIFGSRFELKNVTFDREKNRITKVNCSALIAGIYICENRYSEKRIAFAIREFVNSAKYGSSKINLNVIIDVSKELPSAGEYNLYLKVLKFLE